MNKAKKPIFFVFLMTVGFFALSSLVFAAPTPKPPLSPEARCDNLKKSLQIVPGDPNSSAVQGLPVFCTAGELIIRAINIMLAFAATIAVLFLMVGGYWYLISAGNEETAEKGKKTISNALIGLVVIILSTVIVRVVSGLLTKNIGPGTSTATQQQGGDAGAGGTGGAGGQLTGGITDDERRVLSETITSVDKTSDSTNIIITSSLSNNRQANLVKKACAVNEPISGAIRTEFNGSPADSGSAYTRQGPTTYKAVLNVPKAGLVGQTGTLQIFVCAEVVAQTSIP